MNESASAHFVDVVMALPLGELFTYALPAALAGRVAVGSRVVVPFGRRHLYSAIVVRVHHTAPSAHFELKQVTALLDEKPILLPEQLKFWQWMADYYLCTVGEVCKAALPAGLKLESESLVGLNPDYDECRDLTAREEAVLAALSDGHDHRIGDLQTTAGLENVLPTLRELIELGAVRMSERLREKFRPRTQTCVRLAAPFCSQEALRRATESLARSPKQLALLQTYLTLSRAEAALRLNNNALLEGVSKSALLEQAQATESTLTALRKKGLLETFALAVARRESEALPAPLTAHPLDAQQQRALSQIEALFATKRVVLLHGVTSSGKTELYIHLIKRELEAGRQVLYLLPEIALTTQITRRLQRVFGARMGVYHSKFPDGERVELWQKQLGAEPYDLILGARSALFLPYKRLGLVIVDEEHEASYKQQDPAPRYHARDAAIVLAMQAGAHTLLGTATPSLESYRNALSGKYGLVEMKERHGGILLPEVRVENVAELRRKKEMNSPFSPALLEEMRRAFAAGEQAILFKNRRGYAPVVQCQNCGWTPRCTHCDVTLTYHRRRGVLECHYCGAQYTVPQRCPQCESTELQDRGAGTEKIEEAVQAFFPGVHTARMDLDTTRSRLGYERILEDFRRGRTQVLIGTQMVTKGLDFDHVRVVGILDADAQLSVPDFRSHERAFQMMAQVAGRAGRRSGRGVVILQTRTPEAPVIKQVVANDYIGMFRTQMQERTEFLFPPACRLIYVYVKHRDAAQAARAAACMAAALRPVFGDLLLGPQAPPVARVQSLYIQQLVLKVTPALSPAGVRATLRRARQGVAGLVRSATIYFDADPL